MSKPKKNQKKTPQAKAAAAAMKKKEKKKIDPKVIKTVLITLAAVIGIAAIVLLAIFVIKPAIEKNKAENPDKTTTTTSKVYEQGDEFLQIEYNGLSIPAVFADIIKEAEAERASKCSEYGVALEVGGMKISRPEFNMYYYDQYMEKYFDVQASLKDNGQNMTGFDPEQAPENQKYIRGNGTWADYFSFEATGELQKLYADFDRACKAGTVLPSEEMSSLIAAYDEVLNTASENGVGTDEFMEDMYFGGVDFSMFFARVIMDAYAEQFRTDEKERLGETVTDKELEGKYVEDPKQFQVAKVRVYMIEGEYNAAEAAAVSNLEKFNEYAKNNHPHENFDVDLNTNLGWIAYTDLEAYHGETVANWAFDSSRVVGEIGIVEDFLARYIIYIEEPAFDVYTYQLVCYRNQHIDPSDHEPALSKAKEFNAEWEKSAKSEENFRKLAEKTGYLTEDAAIITRYDLDMAEWFADPARKPGDTKLFDASDAAYVVYFVKANPDDLLWKNDVRKTIAAEKFEEEFKELAAKDYEPEFNETQLKQSYKDAKARVDRYIKSISK